MATAIFPCRSCIKPNPKMKQSRCRKRSPGGSVARKEPVMGQVKILKRGEELKGSELYHRLGPDPDVVQNQIRVSDLYAGPTSMLLSPHPSSLPFPATLLHTNM